jgi:hypothetical protein
MRYPVVFYPELIDGKRVAIGLKEREKSVLIQNDEGFMVKAKNPKELLEKNEELRSLYNASLNPG